MNKSLKMAELRRTLQRYAMDVAKSGAEDSVLMEMASAFPVWRENMPYGAGDIVSYGVNADNETQLYRVVSAHTSQVSWTPDAAASLYKAIGFADDGVPIWTQPLEYSDAYAIGDIVEHKGKRWKCTQGNASGADGMKNTFEPGVWGWTEVAK